MNERRIGSEGGGKEGYGYTPRTEKVELLIESKGGKIALAEKEGKMR